jgi:ATP-dependent RNA helicase DeaD
MGEREPRNKIENTLKNALKVALEKRAYTTLTPVQIEVSKPEFETQDLLVSAQTGSGKTVGFGLAIAPNLLGEDQEFDRADAPLALVIAPTRELAMQVKHELRWLYAEAGVVMASCVGGMDMRDERRALERGAHIVVATPGRLRDHIVRNSIDLTNIRAVVLDEADEMLDLGFSEDLEMILSATPEDRRTLLFSATVPKGIANLAKKYQRDAVRVTTVSEKTQHADIEYQALQVNTHDAENAIINVLRLHEAPNAIVFANTRATVGRLTTRLSNRGFSVVCLSGELSQSERSHALQAMRDGRARICVATDVAARGIDLPKLDLVVHAELPSNHETLLHRSGRTGRAGRKGTSVLIVPPSSFRKADRILKSAKITADWRNPPTADEVLAKDHERLLKDEIWTAEINPSHTDMIATLLDQFGAERIAAAYLELYSKKLSAPEEISETSEPAARKPRPAREDFGPSVWFRMSKGRQDGISPGQIVPMLCKAGDITKTEIGAIRIQGDHTFVELRQDALDGFMAKLGSDAKVEGAKIEQLSEVPDIPPPAADRGFDKPRGTPGQSWDRSGPRENDRDRRPKRENSGSRFHPLDPADGAEKPRFEKPRGDKSRDDKPRAKFDRPDRGERSDRFDRPERKERHKSSGPKSRDDRPRADSKPMRNKPTKELPEGVLAPFKKKSGPARPKSDAAPEQAKPKSTFRKGSSDPSVSLRKSKGPKKPAGGKPSAGGPKFRGTAKGGGAVPKRKG